MNGARVIDTGVPRMKVTDYPLSPRIDTVAPIVVPGCQDCTSTEASSGPIEQHSSSAVIVIPADPTLPQVVPSVPAVHGETLVPVPEPGVLPPQI